MHALWPPSPDSHASLPPRRQTSNGACLYERDRRASFQAGRRAGQGMQRDARRALGLYACMPDLSMACQSRPAAHGPLDRSQRWRRCRPVFPEASRSPDPRVRLQAPSRLARASHLGQLEGGFPTARTNIDTRSRAPFPFATPVAGCNCLHTMQYCVVPRLQTN